MSGRRRIATLFVLAALIAGIYFLFRGAPIERTITYDLGHRHDEVARVDVTILTAMDEGLVRRVSWSFRPGEAPRRLPHSLVLPAEDLQFIIEVENRQGQSSIEHRELDGRERGNVVLFVEVP